MAIKVKNNIQWVGQRDWEVRDFHGTEYKTEKGTSYNSYLIREEKTVLIDTVDHKFSHEFVQNLELEIDLKQIDYIVINHAEDCWTKSLARLFTAPKMPSTLSLGTIITPSGISIPLKLVIVWIWATASN